MTAINLKFLMEFTFVQYTKLKGDKNRHCKVLLSTLSAINGSAELDTAVTT